MQSKLNPYLSFKSNARGALEFYKKVFGGKLTLSTFEENHVPHGPDDGDNIMHGMLEADNGITLMAADIPHSMEYKTGANISISLSGDNEQELSSYYEKLSEDGTIQQPLEKAPWGDTFGMLTDKFGTAWMVNISAQTPDDTE